MDFLIDVDALNKTLKSATYEAKSEFPNQLFCKRETTNELLVLSMENSKVKSSTGLCLTSIDLSCLTRNPEEESKMQSEKSKTYPINFEEDEQIGGDGQGRTRVSSKTQKLTPLDIPHKIILNTRENVLVIVSLHWVGIVCLEDNLLCSNPEYQSEMQLLGCRNGTKDIDKSE